MDKYSNDCSKMRMSLPANKKQGELGGAKGAKKGAGARTNMKGAFDRADGNKELTPDMGSNTAGKRNDKAWLDRLHADTALTRDFG